MNTLYMTLMRLNALQNTASDRLALVEAVDSAYKSVTTASDAELWIVNKSGLCTECRG